MISYVKNNIIIEQPQPAPKSWIDPNTHTSYSAFNNLSLDEIFKLGWKEVIDDPIDYDSFFENLNIGDWYYDSDKDIVTRDYSKSNKEISEVQWNLLIQLDKTTKLIQNSGYLWPYKNIPVITSGDALTKINGEYNAAKDGIRNETTDLFIFYSGPMHLTNADMIQLGKDIRDHVQDIYNISGNFWTEIMSATIIDALKNIKTEIENKNNWPATYI